MAKQYGVSGEAIGSLLLREADQLAREKCLGLDVVFDCLEQAFQRVAKGTYGDDHDIRVTINRHSGHVNIQRYVRVVEEVTDPAQEVQADEEANWHVGQEIVDDLPIPSFNRVTIQTFKSALSKTLYEVERDIQYNEFKDRVGQVISGVVKRMEGGNIVLDVGRTEGILLRSELIPREMYRVGDRLKAYLYQVKREAKGPQVFFSRTHPGFLAKLFAQEVPQIYEGLIEIKAVARDPGSRAKVAIAVPREERSFDPIGACVGVRGSRVNAVSQELGGEKIDIIPWSSELAIFVVNSMMPAEVTKVIMEREGHMKVVVPDHHQSIAIGRRGQNVKLAHQLTGVNLEIVTESMEIQQRQTVAELFMSSMDLDEMMARFLVSEFESVAEIARASLQDLTKMQGITPEIAQELQERAVEALQEEKHRQKEAFLRSGGEEKVLNLGIPDDVVSCLLAKKVLSLKQVADLSLDELLDIVGTDHKDLLTEEAWGEIILKARTHD